MTGHAFPLIEVQGSSYEMGYQHGVQAAELVRRYISWIEKLTHTPVSVLRKNAMAFRHEMEILSPPFLEEVRGLADRQL